jgi:hypothetical protein
MTPFPEIAPAAGRLKRKESLMSRSIFDPTGDQCERSGSTFTPADADDISQLPQRLANPPSEVPSRTVDFQPPPEKPAIDVTAESDGKLLVVRMTGKLHKDDYQHFVPIVENIIQQHGMVRMLVQMHNFHGWDVGAMWEDVKFDARYFNRIERLAVVGEKTWEKWATCFVSKLIGFR